MNEESEKGRTVFRPSPLQARQEAAAAPTPPSSVRSPGDDIPSPAASAPHRNPALAAAQKLLTLLAAVRAGRASIEMPKLWVAASDAVGEVDRAIANRYNEEQARRIRYALCATADDVALNIDASENDRAEWARRSLMVRFFGENIAGDRFWMLLDDMVAKPGEYRDVLQLYHACLACGFLGRYRVIDGGKQSHADIMERIYRALSAGPAASSREISPRWRGVDAPARRPGFWTPLVLAATAALVAMTIVYIILVLILGLSGKAPRDAMIAVFEPNARMELARSGDTPPPVESSQSEGLRTFLAEEIAANKVVVISETQTLRIRTTVGQLFKPASDALEPNQQALFDKIAQALETEPGPIRVEGYTDGAPLRTSVRFADNTALSQARAQTVAAILRRPAANRDRVAVQGLGESDPIAPNDTAEGRSENRRVEIVIQRREP